jgi:hypothetical protein
METLGALTIGYLAIIPLSVRRFREMAKADDAARAAPTGAV